MRDTFDVLYDEGADQPKMMMLALHDRLVGRPGRALGVARFLDHVLKHDRVWIATGLDIARHWIATHPAPRA
jgi:allantoinase